MDTPPNFRFPTHVEHNKNRKFQHQWLTSYSWLVYSRSTDGGICKYCALFSDIQGALITRPLITCNKATEKLKSHNQSAPHKAACTRASHFLDVMRGQMKNVQEQINQGLSDRIAENRKKLRSIIETVILCGRQNISLRGNGEGKDDDHSNFNALLNFRISAGDSVLKKHLQTAPKNAVYTSAGIQNQIIEIIADYLRSKIIADVKKSPFFSVIADEVTDVSNKEQLAVVLRYMDTNDCTQERLVDFIECKTGITGEVLAKTLLECIISYGLDPKLIRGQGYDGAGNMSGPTKGAAAVIQRTYPKALYFHCASHQLNLCVAKSTENTYVRNMIGVIKKVGLFFESHPKRQYAFEEAIIEVTPNSRHLKLKDLCRTRWVARLDAFEVFLELLAAVVHCFEAISQKQVMWSRDTLSDASQLLLAITQPAFVVSLKTTSAILSYIRGITIGLQSKALDIVQASHDVNTVLSVLKDVRENADSLRDKWFEEATKLCEAVGTVPSMPRRCSKQQHRDNMPADTPCSFFKRSVTLPLLDHLINEIQSRFTTLHISALKGLALVPHALTSSQVSNEELKSFIKTDEEDLPSHLSAEAELECWQKKWKTSDRQPDNIQETLQYTIVYPNINTLLRILSCLPVTSCTADRSFSSLKRLKSSLRSSMGTERLSGLALINVHRDIDIDIDDVITVFARRHPRRLTMTNILADDSELVLVQDQH